MSFWVLGCEHHSFWGRLTGREKVDLGSLLSRSGSSSCVIWSRVDHIQTQMVVAFWSQNVTFDSIGDEMSGVFESHFLAFLQGVFPKTISHSIDITACVPRRKPQYSSFILSRCFSKNYLAIRRHNCVCPPARAAVFIYLVPLA